MSTKSLKKGKTTKDNLKKAIKYYISNDTKIEEIREEVNTAYEFYNRKQPLAKANGPKFVSPDCANVVERYLATFNSAFRSVDSFELIPEGIDQPIVIKAINMAINDVVNVSNNKFTILNKFFKEMLIAPAAAMLPCVVEENEIGTEYFDGVTDIELDILKKQYEAENDEVEFIIEESETKEDTSEFELMGEIVSQTVDSTTHKGKIILTNKVKQIKIHNIPIERMIFDNDIPDIEDQLCIGHYVRATISDLLEYGFKEEDVQKVMNSPDSDKTALEQSNSVRSNRNRNFDINDTTIDKSLINVDLYELYVKSSFEETTSNKDISIAKTYKVYYAAGEVLDYEEVSNIPYVLTSCFINTSHLLGESMVNRVKPYQALKTGLMRSILSTNAIATNPRFEYVKEAIHDIRDIFNTSPGAGIAVKAAGTINPIKMTQLDPNTFSLIELANKGIMDTTGVTTGGPSMSTEVLKAGGSNIAAQMVLSQEQQLQKYVIDLAVERAIKPMILKIYELLVNNFTLYPVTIDNQMLPINPSMEWPNKVQDIRVISPVGESARMEKAMSYLNIFNSLGQTAAANPEAAKLFTTNFIRSTMVAVADLTDIPDVDTFLPKEEEVSSLTQMQQQLQQGMQQMQQMQMQMQQMQIQLGRFNEADMKIKQMKTQAEVQKMQSDVEKAVEEAMLKRDMFELDKQRAEVEVMAQAEKANRDDEEFNLKVAAFKSDLAKGDDNLFRPL